MSTPFSPRSTASCNTVTPRETVGGKRGGTTCSPPVKALKIDPACTPRSRGGEKIPDCLVCLDTLGTDGGTAVLGCQHAFCKACIATHCARQERHDQAASCPLCKAAISSSELVLLGPAKEQIEESEDEGPGPVVVFESQDGQRFYVRLDDLYADDDDDDDDDEEAAQQLYYDYFCEWNATFDGSGEVRPDDPDCLSSPPLMSTSHSLIPQPHPTAALPHHGRRACRLRCCRTSLSSASGSTMTTTRTTTTTMTTMTSYRSCQTPLVVGGRVGVGQDGARSWRVGGHPSVRGADEGEGGGITESERRESLTPSCTAP